MKVLLYILFGLLSWSAARAEEPAKPSLNVHQLIRNAVPFIEKKGADWIEKRDCLSCHHTSFMVWSLNSSKNLGIEVSSEKLPEWNTWATQWQHHIKPEQRDKASPEKTMQGASDTIAQLILGNTYHAAGFDNDIPYATSLLAAQNDDGSWKAGGQLPRQRRPARETGEVSTMWVMLALQSSDLPPEVISKSLQRGYTWLSDKTIGLSTEWWALRTSLERSLGKADKAQKTIVRLRGYQNDDGGWGWLCEDKSDALGTGIVLYILAREGIGEDDPAVGKALRFLEVTQREDGSWPVPGTKQGDENDFKPTSVFWGTSWAVIGASEYAKPVK